MPAFKDSQRATLAGTIQALFDRTKWADPFTLTHDEFLNLFAPADHRHILKEAPRLTAEAVYSHSVSVHLSELRNGLRTSLSGRMNKIGGYHPLIPRAPALQPDAPTELLNKVTEWVARQVEIAIAFGRVNRVMHDISNYCSNPAQVRYLWPAILPLCRKDEALRPLAEKIEEFRRPQNVPTLPVSLRAACQVSAGTIISALLLPDEPGDPSAPPATLSVSVSGIVTEGGFSFSPM